jgi:hypothetical protein
VIPQGGQPELGNTRDGRVLLSLLDLGDLGSLLFLFVLLVRVGRLALLDLLVGRLDLARDDGGTALVQGLVLDEELVVRQYAVRRITPNTIAEQVIQVVSKPKQEDWRLGEDGIWYTTHLLLELEDGHLELALNLRVLDLDALEAVETTTDRCGEGLDVSRGRADESAKLALGEREKGRVLR